MKNNKLRDSITIEKKVDFLHCLFRFMWLVSIDGFIFFFIFLIIGIPFKWWIILIFISWLFCGSRHIVRYKQYYKIEIKDSSMCIYYYMLWPRKKIIPLNSITAYCIIDDNKKNNSISLRQNTTFFLNEFFLISLSRRQDREGWQNRFYYLSGWTHDEMLILYQILLKYQDKIRFDDSSLPHESACVVEQKKNNRNE